MSISRWALPLAACSLFMPGCKLLDRLSGKGDDEKSIVGDDSGTGSPTGTGSAVGSGSPSTPGVGTASTELQTSLRDVTYALGVTVQPDGAALPAPATYEAVRDTFANRCVSCHAAGNALDLSRWPFTGRFATPAEAVKEILARVQSPTKPMPPVPAAALGAAEIQTLKDWSDGGLKEKPEVVTAPFADTVTVLVRAQSQHAEQDVEARMPWNGSGQFTGSLRLPLYDMATVKVAVLGEDGTELAVKIYDQLAVGPVGDFFFAVTVTDASIRAHVVDKVGPAPGADGVVTASAVNEKDLTLNWGRATDQLSAPGALSYAVFIADEATGFDSVEGVLAKGRKVMDFTKDLSGSKISGLVGGRTYVFAVLVKDEAGNQTLYKILQQATALDRVAPMVPTPTITATAITDVKATLTWKAGSDNFSPPEKLLYQVYFSPTNNINTVADAGANGTLVGVTKPGIVAMNVVGIVPESTYFFNVIAVDENGNQAAFASVQVVSKAPVGTQDSVAHAKLCAERLGTVKPFSCFDGEVLPITVNGQAIGPNLTAQQIAQYNLGNTTSSQLACDKPALLGLGAFGHCVPYSRVGRLKTYRKDGSENPNVDTVFTCRRYAPRVGKVAWQGQLFDGQDYPGFEDIAMIMHDRVSGETCFYQMLEPNKAPKDGRRIPPPTEEALPAGSPAYALPARNFWIGPEETAAINCNRCHDSDPWMHSPYIDQVRTADGKPIVPSGALGGGRSGKYSVLGARGFYKWQKSKAVVAADGGDSQGKSCTSCHNIGNINTCAEWISQSVGLTAAPNLSTRGATDFAHKYWMPPAESGLTNVADWLASGFDRAAERLRGCCKYPTSAGCTLTPIMTMPPPYALD